jgi:thiamine pyrophosphokinase
MEGEPKTSVLRYPKDKDETDFELALGLALEEVSPDGSIKVLGAFGGGRLDMAFSNLLLPAALLPVQGKRPSVAFLEGSSQIFILCGKDRLSFQEDLGPRTVSILPLSPEAEGVSLQGDFRYPLGGGRLLFGLTLGISNEFFGGQGSVSLERGTIAVFVQPRDA